jgi:hypothetical protein
LHYTQAGLHHNPPVYASCIAGMAHHNLSFYWLRLEGGVSLRFSPGYHQTTILLLSASQVPPHLAGFFSLK